MKRNSLQIRLFLAYLLLILFVVGLITLLFSRYTSDILVARETGAQLDSLAATVYRTEEAVREMENVSISIGYSGILREKLGESVALDVAGADFKTISEVMLAINGAEVRVDQINLYDFSGYVLGVGFNTNTSKSDVRRLPDYDAIMELGGGRLLTAPYYTVNYAGPNPHAGDWFLSQYRLFRNQYGRVTGVSETVKRCRAIFKDVSAHARFPEGRDVYVYDGGGGLVYPYNPAQSNPAPAVDYFALLDPAADHVTHRDGSEGEQLIAYQTSDYTGWTYVAVQSLEQTLAPVRQFNTYLILGAVLLAVLCVFLSYSLAKSLTRPIRELGEIIEGTELHTLGQAKTDQLSAPFEEFRKLTDAYQSMSVNLKRSMEEVLEARQQEMRSRSLALQSQINPHFYYNTLSSIIVLAENGKTDDVVAICHNLSSIMRYITHGGDQLVTIREELDYITKYLYCMKVRYQESLVYSIEVEESLLDLKIPKLLIQPLVENAVKYGTNSLPPWRIEIRGQTTEGGWRIEVADSGPGFTAEALAMLGERFRRARDKTGMPELEIDGMGLLNVYTRWQLFAGEEALFRVGNGEGGGAVATVGKEGGSAWKGNTP